MHAHKPIKETTIRLFEELKWSPSIYVKKSCQWAGHICEDAYVEDN